MVTGGNSAAELWGAGRELLDRVGRQQPLADVLDASAQLLELHFGLSGCAVRLATAARTEAESVVRYIRSATGDLLAVVTTPESVPEKLVRNDDFEGFCDLLGHALEIDRLRAALEQQGSRDNVTSLPNWRSFELTVASVLPKPAALLWIDLDRFKDVNERLGHHTGDELLRQVATRFLSVLPPGAVMTRNGGDEFGILLQTDKQADAEALASSVLSALKEPFQVGGIDLVVTCSIGLALCPTHGTTAADLRQNADTAMYMAKSRGRNAYAVYDLAAGAAVRDRLELIHSLRGALGRDELELHFQPQVDLDGGLHGFEALLRWRHPQRGLLFPGQFIDIAEETGLVVPIGAWVLEEACRKCVLWNTQRTTPVKVAVNVSPLQLYFSDLLEVVRNALGKTGLPARLLELELTESTLLRESGKCIRDLEAIRRLGVSIAIDDFGSGYSCLSYLQRLPVDVLKIDRSFFIDDCHGPSNSAVLHAITALARGLGLQVVAEGIERDDQIPVLRALQVNLVQGYLFGRPRPLSDAERV